MSFQQPFVHDLTLALCAPVQIWSKADGEIDGAGAQGVYLGDHRVLRELSMRLEGPDGPIGWVHGSTSAGADGAVTFHAVARVHDSSDDPVGSLTRTRTPHSAGFDERIVVATSLPVPIQVRLTLRLVPDATPINRIKAGAAQPAEPQREGAAWRWGTGTSATVHATGAEVVVDEAIHLHWTGTVPRYGSLTLQWGVTAVDEKLPFAGSVAAPVAVPPLRGASTSLSRLVTRSVADLNALRLCEHDDPSRTFYAAGAPWFLTLFGRDSLIAARLALPVDASMALATLRTLAARQGRVVDIDRAEQPGKMLHEIRAEALDLLQGTVLPPEYYGTVDATPLWVLLLADGVASGIDPVQHGLFDALLAALGWLRDHSDPDGDGFAEYHDTSGHGLANQGWKDSGDSIRFADGHIADGPIALAEVQGYCYAAALAGADLLQRFGRTPAERAQADQWLAWAAALKARFRELFWIRDEHGDYPALALDRDKRAVTGVASNMGHLLGTGLLDSAEERQVVDRLMSPDMFSGYGIRTMSTTNAAYWPTRYHVGSVWTHDTAMIIDGMLRAGFDAEATRLAEGLLRAAEGFDHRLPELFGGQSSDTAFPPVPYPASCRPQAWAAAAGITVAKALGAL